MGKSHYVLTAPQLVAFRFGVGPANGTNDEEAVHGGQIVCFLREADTGLPVKEPVPSEGLSGLCGLSAGNGGQGPTALLAFRAIAGNVVSVSYRFQRT